MMMTTATKARTGKGAEGAGDGLNPGADTIGLIEHENVFRRLNMKMCLPPEQEKVFRRLNKKTCTGKFTRKFVKSCLQENLYSQT